MTRLAFLARSNIITEPKGDLVSHNWAYFIFGRYLALFQHLNITAEHQINTDFSNAAPASAAASFTTLRNMLGLLAQHAHPTCATRKGKLRRVLRPYWARLPELTCACKHIMGRIPRKGDSMKLRKDVISGQKKPR